MALGLKTGFINLLFTQQHYSDNIFNIMCVQASMSYALWCAIGVIKRTTIFMRDHFGDVFYRILFCRLAGQFMLVSGAFSLAVIVTANWAGYVRLCTNEYQFV